MVRFNISVNSDVLAQLQNALAASSGEGAFPATSYAIGNSAERIAKMWRSFAEGGTELEGVKPLKRPNRSYLFGIKTNRVGTFNYEIYNETKAADSIKNGRPAIDMKKTHTRGPRSRVSNEDIPYLIVPFRWGTPPEKGKQRVGFKNVMPTSVYNRIRNDSRFMPTVTTVDSDSPKADKTPNARGEMAGRAQYSSLDKKSGWGDTFTADMLKKESAREGVTDDMIGMSRMLGDDGKAAGYFTFRVISAKKPRGWDSRPHKKAFEDMWILKEEPPRDVVSALVNAARQDVSDLVEKAIRSDLRGILPQ
jgi:hypothetical protein